MRKLVTVRKVGAIRPIKDADAIECAVVEGWEVVVKKGEFKPGDACVFFEIDSFLPLDNEQFAFLEKNRITWNHQQGVRLRTMKLRGQLSQGLILPLGSFAQIQTQIEGMETDGVREMDFTQALGVQKWEAPIPAELQGEVEGAFPSVISKTDQERIQNLPHLLTEQAQTRFEVSIKLDGTSMTVFFYNGKTGVCGRNWELKNTPTNSLWKLVSNAHIDEALQALGRHVALQGEMMGEGIQGNHEKLEGHHFYLFDIFDIDQGRYLAPQARKQLLAQLREQGARIDEVPVLDTITLEQFKGEMAAILSYAQGPSLNPQLDREGVVFKSEDGQTTFKVISNKYLLKHGA